MEAIEKLLPLIEKNFPIPGRFREKLPFDIADLSRLLTSARGERDGGYLNRPNMLSAYLRYFLPWNVFRLCKLFSLKAGVQAEQNNKNILSALSDGDIVTDLGSGPLTLPIALWIAFPELRNVKLEFRCVDKSAAILDAGYKLFKALCAISSSNTSGNVPGWKIKTIHDSIGAPIRGKPAKFVTAVNVFNEVYTEMQRSSIERSAEKTAALLCRLCAGNGSILAVEPGNPQGGAFISALRAALLEKGKYPAAPCTHTEVCPLPGINTLSGNTPHQAHSTKNKWCHFAFNTDTAPYALHELSLKARIPKERATLSFLLAGPKYTTKGKPDLKLLPIRIVSDTFPVTSQKNNIGCYGCSEQGMVLVTGNRTQFNAILHGSLLTLSLPEKEQRDAKTGALIIPL
ncbi:MAG: small ribosomal subunit Rsm22 family protein [Treponema sp.]|nr:small ribosomal subunit Rsm22 family protein [Treponema sp.]